MFARQLNRELPRGLVGALGGVGSLRLFGETPMCGFAEQFRAVGTAGFAQVNGTSEETSLGGMTDEEALQLAALANGDVTFYLSQWSGLVSRECVSKIIGANL
jgi:hypothetical protein